MINISNKPGNCKWFLLCYFKKSLKTQKGQSESVYRRRTDNTMAKRKSTKGQTYVFFTYLLFITMGTKYMTKYM